MACTVSWSRVISFVQLGGRGRGPFKGGRNKLRGGRNIGRVQKGDLEWLVNFDSLFRTRVFPTDWMCTAIYTKCGQVIFTLHLCLHICVLFTKRVAQIGASKGGHKQSKVK